MYSYALVGWLLDEKKFVLIKKLVKKLIPIKFFFDLLKITKSEKMVLWNLLEKFFLFFLII
jgi:hypothetical protein